MLCGVRPLLERRDRGCMATPRITMTFLAAVPTGNITEQVLKYSCKFSVWFAEENKKVTCSDKSDIRYLFSEHPVCEQKKHDVKEFYAEKHVSS